MKTPTNILSLLTAAAVIFTLPCCSTTADGHQTFGGLDAVQWGGVAVQTGSAYLDTRRQPAAVPATSAKGSVQVQPASASAAAPAVEISWLSMGLSLLGF